MKKALFFMVMATAMAFTSCGSGDKKDAEKEASSDGVTATDPAINSEKGLDLSDYIAVESVSKPTLVEGELSYENCISVNVKLKVIKKIEVKGDGIGIFRVNSIDLCDEDENTLVTADGYESIENLINAEPGKVIAVSMKTYSIDKNTAKDYIARTKKVRVNTYTSGYEFGTPDADDDEGDDDADDEGDGDDDSNVSYSSSSTSSSSSSGSEDWDSVLDSYERYVDKYIAMMKKAQAGDASALAEYPSLLEEAEEYGNKLQNASGSLSSSQIARYQNINNKMIQAAK